LKLSRFAHRIALTSSGGNIVRRIHPERARALLASGDARLRSAYPSGSIDEIILTNRLFAAPIKPKSFIDPRNWYSSRSSQDTNVPRGTLRSTWFGLNASKA
jgi:hypothetical protein